MNPLLVALAGLIDRASLSQLESLASYAVALMALHVAIIVVNRC